jgi:AraC family transcriptional regulator of adaptative response/methylated-DNA-[protein]-cysteine methyltransferase
VVERISEYLRKHADRRVTLEELGRVAGCSPFTAQRSFRAALGVSPAEYQRGLRAKELRRELKNESNITDAVYAAGYGSSSRAYERSPLGMTPSSYKKGGEGEQIGYIATQTNLGWLLVAATARGICAVNLGSTKQEAVRALGEEFPRAKLLENNALSPTLDEVLSTIADAKSAKRVRMPLDLRGTAFQIEVWRALQRIPRGETRSYSQLAAELGRPRATRAVARACGQNRLAVVVPCHRVIGANGSLTGYRWGLERKQKLLCYENNQRAKAAERAI